MRIALVAAAVGALFATQASAMTWSTSQDQQRRVSFRGVNFNDQAQVDAFYARLKAVARTACSSGEYHSAARDRDCAQTVVNQAVAGLQRPMLTARHQAVSADTRYATGF